MRILIPDTQGEEISPEYRALLPGLEIRGRDYPGANAIYHDHGAWCGYLAGLPLVAAIREGMISDPVELIFVQIFDRFGKMLPDASDWLLMVIDEERPDYISTSSGAWDGDDYFQDQLQRAVWSEFALAYANRIRSYDMLAGFSAGNNDENDVDADTAYPQVLFQDDCLIVGSRNVQGTPSKFSGDGAVDYMMVGEYVFSPNMKGEWTRWRGTSAACPKLVGLAAAHQLSRSNFNTWANKRTSTPDGTGLSLPHPKWGWGDLEEQWQQLVTAVPELLPNTSALETYTVSNKVY